MSGFAPRKPLSGFALIRDDYQFLYAEGEMLVFMDTTSYEQIELQKRVYRGSRRLFTRWHDGQGGEL